MARRSRHSRSFAHEFVGLGKNLHAQVQPCSGEINERIRRLGFYADSDAAKVTLCRGQISNSSGKKLPNYRSPAWKTLEMLSSKMVTESRSRKTAAIFW